MAFSSHRLWLHGKGLKICFSNKTDGDLSFYAPQSIPNNLVSPLPLTLCSTPYRSSSCLPLLSNAVCSYTLRGSLFLWVPAPSCKPETAIVIEYSIGEPFNKTGNGIRLCINVLCWNKRSYHHLKCSSCFKRTFSLPSLQAMRSKMTRISFFLFSLSECSSTNIFSGYLAYFPIHPSAPLPDLGGRIQAAPQNVTVTKSPSGVLARSPFFSSVCMRCVRGQWGL